MVVDGLDLESRNLDLASVVMRHLQRMAPRMRVEAGSICCGKQPHLDLDGSPGSCPTTPDWPASAWPGQARSPVYESKKLHREGRGFPFAGWRAAAPSGTKRQFQSKLQMPTLKLA